VAIPVAHQQVDEPRPQVLDAVHPLVRSPLQALEQREGIGVLRRSGILALDAALEHPEDSDELRELLPQPGSSPMT